MKNITYITDGPNQAGAYWRSTMPFAYMRKHLDSEFKFEHRYAHPKEVGADLTQWSAIAGSDVVFMHRPFTQDHLRIVNLCRDMKVPVWLDYDDLLTAIPYDNKTFHQYMDVKTQDNIIKMILAADVVTVSTYEMKRQLDRYRSRKDCIVVRNSIPTDHFDWRDTEVKMKVKRVVWRGSEHHQKDLLHVKDDIIRVANKFPDIEFYFVGFKPWYIIEEVKNAYTVAPTDIMSYFKMLHHLHPQIVMTPLFDNIFNRCKSNIAAIEAGIACGTSLSPNWEEWNLDGAIGYSSGNFFAALDRSCEMLNENTQVFVPNAEELWSDIEANYDLHEWNNTRGRIISSLLGEDDIGDMVEDDCISVYGMNRDRVIEESLIRVERPVEAVADTPATE